MIARLLGVIGIVLAGVVLPATPAFACSCVGLDRVLADEPDTAFVGVLRRQRGDNSKVINRLRVERVFDGEVHRTQDVVSPRGGEGSCGVEWPEGSRVLVLGHVDEESRIATNLCTSVVEGDEHYDAVLAELGEGRPPLAGADVVERDGVSLRDLVWFRIAVAVIGLAGVGVLFWRFVRSRRAGGPPHRPPHPSA